MRNIVLNEAFFEGAASVEHVNGGLKPWRLPHQRRHLFPSPNDGLMNVAAHASGVRLRLKTDSTALRLDCLPLPEPGQNIPKGHWFDVVIENQIVASEPGMKDAEKITFDNLPGGEKILEVWLPPSCPVTITGLSLDDGSSASAAPDERPLWVSWGSSLTHCVLAGSAAKTWPAIVAREHDLNLVNLGFGGQCHLDPMVATHIRDLPAKFISLKLGINAIGGTVNARTYPALVTAAVMIIREKHPETPMALISPIGFPPNETTPNVVGYTIGDMRRDMKETHRRLVEAGDENLHYVDGLTLFSVEEIEAHTADQCHPDANGMVIQAAHFSENVIPLLFNGD